MEQTAFKIEKFYTVKEIARITNKSTRSIKDYCKSGKILAITIKARGGEQYRISESALKVYAVENNIDINTMFHSSFEQEDNSICSTADESIPALSLKIKSKNSHTHIPCLRSQSVGLASGSDKNSSQPASAFSLIEKNTHILTVGQGANQRNLTPALFPEKAKKIALARMDLLTAWADFRRDSEQKSKADEYFVELYNLQQICNDIYKKIGTVSKGTLYRWQKMLNNSGDYTSLVPNYSYQANTQKQTKLSEIEQKYFLDLLLLPGKRTSIGNATRLTKFMLSRQGIQTSSDITYRRFADWYKEQNYDSWILIREGEKALVDKVAPFIERDASLLEVGDVLVADGHVLDFQVINPFNGKPCRATLVGYIDWKSWALAGYEIMLTENTQCITSALRNSIINLGKIPKICYQDNGRAFRSKFFSGSKSFEECGFYGLFGKLGIVPVFAQPYNAKAKIIERFFREFSETCEKLLPSYIGNSIVNKPAYMMRNEKFHKSIHNDFVPTIEQAVQLIDTWMEFHNSQPCPNVKDKTIGEVYNAGRGEGFDLTILDDLLMAENLRKVGRNGVKFLNNNYWSEELYAIKEQVVIKYSLFDLSSIKVYGDDGRFICQAQTMMQIHPMAKILGDAKDVYSLNKAIKTSKKLQNQTIQKVKQRLPQANKELLGWQNTTVEAPKKVKKEKDYGQISVDISQFSIEEKPKTKEIPLFDWQFKEEQQRLQS